MYSRKIRLLSVVLSVVIGLSFLNPSIIEGNSQENFTIAPVEDIENSEYKEDDNATKVVAETEPADKISQEVWDTKPNKDGMKLICIWREKVENEEIKDKFYKRHNYHIEDYEDEARFQMNVLPGIKERVKNKNKNSNTITANMITEIQNEKSEERQLNEEVNIAYDDFIRNKRKIVSELYDSGIDGFIKRNSIDESRVEYKGSYTGTIIMYATDEEIKALAEDEQVLEISIWEEIELHSNLNAVEKQIGTDDVTGTGSKAYGSGSGYDGTGIKVGIIEVNNQRFDPNNPHLKELVESGQLTFIEDDSTDPAVIGDHATYMTSIIVGKDVVKYGAIYGGIAQGATVYQMAATSNRDVLDCLDTLIAKYNVSVVNCSFGNDAFGTGYSDFDKEIDCAINNAEVTIVVSAGNTGTNIEPPGKAYNVITVGNAATKYTSESIMQTPYEINEWSSYSEANYLTNKPDIVAPGTNIRYIDSNNNIYMDNGTSQAAAVVTGIVAQLHQARSVLRSSAEATKAVIIAGADASKITTENNPTKGNAYIREKSGAGIVDAVASMDIAVTYCYLSRTFDLTNDTIPEYYQYKINLNAGQRIRIVLTFSKSSYDNLTSKYKNNVDLYLLDANGKEVASSKSEINNVEIIEFTATSTGSYKMEIFLKYKDIETESDENENDSKDSTVLNVGLAWEISRGRSNVIFDGNGGSCSTLSKVVLKGNTYGTLPTPTRSGYTFVGWFTTKDIEGIEVTSTTTVTNDKNHILYAHWARTYRITNVGANKCLNIYGSNLTSLSEGKNVTIWSNSGSNEQKWLITGTGNQRYIRSVIDKKYGLNVYRSGNPYNCNVHTIIGNETDAQIDFVSVSGGYKIKLHNYDLYLTVGSSSDGANVYWAAASSSSYQVWSLTVV